MASTHLLEDGGHPRRNGDLLGSPGVILPNDCRQPDAVNWVQQGGFKDPAAQSSHCGLDRGILEEDLVNLPRGCLAFALKGSKLLLTHGGISSFGLTDNTVELSMGLCWANAEIRRFNAEISHSQPEAEAMSGVSDGVSKPVPDPSPRTAERLDVLVVCQIDAVVAATLEAYNQLLGPLLVGFGPGNRGNGANNVVGLLQTKPIWSPDHGIKVDTLGQQHLKWTTDYGPIKRRPWEGLVPHNLPKFEKRHWGRRDRAADYPFAKDSRQLGHSR